MIAHLRRLGVPLLAAVLLALPSRLDSYCECLQGLGPCGNDLPTALPGGCFNSTHQKGFLGPIGSLSVAADDLVLSSFNLPAQSLTVLFMGGGTAQTPLGDGVLCVSAGGVGLFRFPPRRCSPTGATQDGPGLVAWSKANLAPPGWIQAGQTWHFQRWYRDPGGPCGSGFNLTNGLGLSFVP